MLIYDEIHTNMTTDSNLGTSFTIVVTLAGGGSDTTLILMILGGSVYQIDSIIVSLPCNNRQSSVLKVRQIHT